MGRDELTYEHQHALQRQLNLCAKNLQKLVDMAAEYLGPAGGVYMDASPCLYVMDGDGSADASASTRQEHIVLASPPITGRLGAGDW